MCWQLAVTYSCWSFSIYVPTILSRYVSLHPANMLFIPFACSPKLSSTNWSPMTDKVGCLCVCVCVCVCVCGVAVEFLQDTSWEDPRRIAKLLCPHIDVSLFHHPPCPPQVLTTFKQQINSIPCTGFPIGSWGDDTGNDLVQGNAVWLWKWAQIQEKSSTRWTFQ
jgi:hypothetical protein